MSVPEIEDDPGELVELIADLYTQGDTTRAAKQQLRTALVKLIDERIAAAFDTARLTPVDRLEDK